MIRKLFRVTGGFVAFVLFTIGMIPPLLLAMPFVVSAWIRTRSVNADLLRDTWEIKFVSSWQWPNTYMEILCKITGWKY